MATGSEEGEEIRKPTPQEQSLEIQQQTTQGQSLEMREQSKSSTQAQNRLMNPNCEMSTTLPKMLITLAS